MEKTEKRAVENVAEVAGGLPSKKAEPANREGDASKEETKATPGVQGQKKVAATLFWDLRFGSEALPLARECARAGFSVFFARILGD